MDGSSDHPTDFHHLLSSLSLEADSWQSLPADAASSLSSVTDGLRLQSAIPAQLHPHMPTPPPDPPSTTPPPTSTPIRLPRGPASLFPASDSVRPPPSPQSIPSPSFSRRSARFDVELPGHSRSPIARIEKDVDDPTTPVGSRRPHDRSEQHNIATLSRLFAGCSPVSRRGTPSSRTQSTPASAMGSLAMHLYTKGLLHGRHSDITIVAFGNSYHLHRLVLDQAPYFSSMLSGPWRESRAEEVTLHPEQVDSCITEPAFGLTLKYLYGCDISHEEDAECLGLFATACWLELTDLVDSSINAILRRMHPDNLGPLIKLVTMQYYGRAGERILASAKAMLCRDGSEMKLRNWDEIPGETVREIVGGDGFYIHGEWERWVLAKRLLDRRLKKVAAAFGLAKPGRSRGAKAPDTLGLMAVRFDSVYRQNAITTGLSRQEQALDDQQKWIALYTHHEIEPLLVLLEEGIHYIHLEFGQLQFIRTARDTFYLPIVSEKAITNALWMQMELRQKVLSASPQDLELGLSETAAQDQPDVQSPPGRHSAKTQNPEPELDEMDSGSWDANGQPRKFWIPSADCNIVMGGAAEPVVTTTTASHHASRPPAALQPEDAQWATDFSIIPDAIRMATPLRPALTAAVPSSQVKGMSYTLFPPFRFAAEFPSPRLLKEKKRVYSRTVFYAGSLWNIYIQKVRSSKNPQLGVYLHRAKELAADDGTGAADVTSVSSRRSRQAEQVATAMMGIGPDDDNTSGSGGDGEPVPSSTTNAIDSSRSGDRPHRQAPAELTAHDLSTSAGLPEWLRAPWATAGTDVGGGSADGNADESETENLTHSQYVRHQLPGNPYYHPSPSPSPTTSSSSFTGKQYGDDRQPDSADIYVPPYIDGRPTIRTYFKIYSPSKGGRLLSVYESAPDRFNFSQSWGWKSSTLMLDDGNVAAPSSAAHLVPSSSTGEPPAEAHDGLTGAPADGAQQTALAGEGVAVTDGSRRDGTAWKKVRQKSKGRRAAAIYGRLRQLVMLT